MIFLLFTARLQERKRWHFWKRELAEVYAMVPVDALDEAEARARSDMLERGYSVEKLHVKQNVSEWVNRKLQLGARMNIWVAKKYGPYYQFYKHSDLWSLESDDSQMSVQPSCPPDATRSRSEIPVTLDPLLSRRQFYDHTGEWPMPAAEASSEPPLQVRSRLLDDPKINIDGQRVPERLRALLAFGQEWAILDDVERAQFIRITPLEKKRVFVDAVIPHLDEIAEFSKKHESDTPVPDEVVLLNCLAEAADEAYYDVHADS